MTDWVLVAGVSFVAAGLFVLLAAAIIYEHRRLSGDEGDFDAQLDLARKTDADHHVEVLAGLLEVTNLLRELQARLDQHDHEHDHPHDHPHQHEHVQHTHTLEKRSQHEENGRLITVKVCSDCNTVFRDKGG